MPTPQQMAILRASAAQRALAAQRATALQAAAANGTNGAQPAAEGTSAEVADGDPTTALSADAALELTPEDLAAFDEIADEDVLPAGAIEDLEAAATMTAEAADEVAAQAVIEGLAGGRPRQMTLQRGDEALEPVGSAPVAAEAGSKVGRNDPCYCGSGLKYKKCHGK